MAGERFARGDWRVGGDYGFQLFVWSTNFDRLPEMLGWIFSRKTSFGAKWIVEDLALLSVYPSPFGAFGPRSPQIDLISQIP